MQLKVDIEDSILKIQEKIRENYDPINPDHLKRLQKEMEEFGDEMNDFICEKSAAHLRRFWVYRCKISPFDWLSRYGPIDPEVLMVHLTMYVDKDLHDQRLSHNCVVDQREILDKKDPGGNEPNVIIISGDAGFGKTTLLRWFLEKWQKELNDDIPGLSNFPLVLYMEFRKHDPDNFDKFLKDLLPRQVAEFGFDQVKSAILLSHSLILCDGFDEKNPNSLKLFEEILEQNFKVIVTTCPVNKKEVTQIINDSGKQSLNLTMIGLKDKDIKVLITKLTNHFVPEEDKREEINEEIYSVYNSMTAEMKQLLMIPLYFNLFCIFYIDCPDVREELNNETNLFTQLNNHRSKRLKTKCKLDAKQISEFNKFYMEWSLRYFIQGKYELGEDDIIGFKRICRKQRILDFEYVMSSYFTIKHTRKGLEDVPIYAYRHRLEQEFAAAGAISDKIIDIFKENKNEFDDLLKYRINMINHVFKCFDLDIPRNDAGDDEDIDEEEDKNDLREIMKFVTGILFARREQDLLYSVLKDIFHHCEIPSYHNRFNERSSLLDHILQTNHDSNMVDAVAKTMRYYLRRKGLHVGRKHLSCVRPLVSKIQPKKIYFDLPHEDDPDNLTHLIPALIASSNTYVKIRGLLNESGIKVLPSRIVTLYLDLQLQDLPCLAEKIPDLVHLNEFELYLKDDGSFHHHERLSPLTHRKGSFSVLLTVTSVVPDYSVPDRVTNILNAIWPSDVWETVKTFRYLWLSSDGSYEYTGDDIKQIMNELTVQNLDKITILSPSDDAMRWRKTLESICKKRGLGMVFLEGNYISSADEYDLSDTTSSEEENSPDAVSSEEENSSDAVSSEEENSPDAVSS